MTSFNEERCMECCFPFSSCIWNSSVGEKVSRLFLLYSRQREIGSSFSSFNFILSVIKLVIQTPWNTWYYPFTFFCMALPQGISLGLSPICPWASPQLIRNNSLFNVCDLWTWTFCSVFMLLMSKLDNSNDN